MASPRLLKLRTSDDQIFEVEEGVIALSVTIKNLIDDGCADGVVPLTNVWSGALAKVIEWCRKHSKADGGSDELKKWDEDFIQVPNNELYDLILAANYLNVKDLLDLGCQRVADMIKGKTPEQIRKVLGIQNDFTPEEEEEIRKENSWAFE